MTEPTKVHVYLIDPVWLDETRHVKEWSSKMKTTYTLRQLSISSQHYALAKRIASHVNNRNLRTAEGFLIRVRIGDVAEIAIQEFAKKLKVK